MSSSRAFAAESIGRRERSRSRAVDLLVRLLRQRGAPLALSVLLVIVLAAIFAPAIAPFDPNATAGFNGNKPPGAEHWLGTDSLGRDIFSRLVFGARISIQVGIIAVGFGISVGAPLGLAAGYIGGAVDSVVMRLLDVLIAFPTIILALALMSAVGSGIPQLMVAIGIGTVPLYARLSRGQVLAVRENEYILAARSMGCTDVRIAARHILPNIVSPLIVQGSLGVGFAILSEASLSFLGLGVALPTATWGGMLSEGLSLIRVSPYLTLFPGLAIFITVLAINMVGDALRDVLDPRLRNSR